MKRKGNIKMGIFRVRININIEKKRLEEMN
jgi:hypothetical protein